MTDQIELDRAVAPVREPSRGWRNVWRITRTGCYQCGCVYRAGNVVRTPCCQNHSHWPAFPSREVAEHFGRTGNARNAAEGWPAEEYLGPEPAP